MTNTHPEQFGAGRIDTPDLLLAWEEAPWDSRIFGAPVLQVTDIARSEERRVGKECRL